MKSVHEDTRNEEMGEESEEEEGEEGEDDNSNLEDQAKTIESNCSAVESIMRDHRVACIAYNFTRLPCAAHKVRFY